MIRTIISTVTAAGSEPEPVHLGATVLKSVLGEAMWFSALGVLHQQRALSRHTRAVSFLFAGAVTRTRARVLKNVLLVDTPNTQGVAVLCSKASTRRVPVPR